MDPGHGGAGSAHSGAVYPPFVEKSINFAVASQVRDELEDAGVTAFLTRQSDDESLSLEERAGIAQSLEADLLISIHFNSSGPHDKFGSEVWTSLYSPYFDTGVMLGSSVLHKLSELGFANKGVKTRSGNFGDYYGIIRNGVKMGIPTVIIEHCFIDSAIDRQIMDEVGLEGIAHADAEGILQYLYSLGDLESSSFSKRHIIGDNEDNTDNSSDYYDINKDRYNKTDTSREKYSKANKLSQEEIDARKQQLDENIKKNTPSTAHSISESKTGLQK